MANPFVIVYGTCQSWIIPLCRRSESQIQDGSGQQQEYGGGDDGNRIAERNLPSKVIKKFKRMDKYRIFKF